MAAAAPPSSSVPSRLFRLSIGLFFIGGFLSSLVNLLVPRLTMVNGLTYARALMIQLAFHMSYLLFAVPIALAVIRLGYMRSAAIGLTVMAAGCTGLLLAYGAASYPLVLTALLALSAGTTFLQIAGNNIVAVVGDARGASVRLNLLQAFNSFGTVAGPLAGAGFLLGTGAGRAGAMAPPFIFAIALLIALAIACLAERDLLAGLVSAQTAARTADWARLIHDRHLIAGAGAIFAYVGAEVTIGALLANYLVRADVLGVSPVAAGRMVSLFWGGAMVGRAAGAYAMKRVAPARLLLAAAVAAALLAIVAATVRHTAGAAALTAIGLCASIMYPTIYVMALPREPALATPGATVLCMAVVGGSVIPMLTGLIADRAGLPPGLLVPALCFALIAAFAWAFGGRRGAA